MNQEIEIAKRHDKRIVPVLLGSGSELPEMLQDFHSLRIENLDKVADLAQGILKLLFAQTQEPKSARGKKK